MKDVFGINQEVHLINIYEIHTILILFYPKIQFGIKPKQVKFNKTWKYQAMKKFNEIYL